MVNKVSTREEIAAMRSTSGSGADLCGVFDMQGCCRKCRCRIANLQADTSLCPLGRFVARSESAHSQAADDVIAERQRQIEKEGWSAEHDYEHFNGDLSRAAACYALHNSGSAPPRDLWPWDMEWWKPKDRRRNLVRAAALLLAEIERLDWKAKP